MAKALLLLALLGGPVRAATLSSFDLQLGRHCSLDVSQACRSYCSGGAGPETCPWRDFGCDFRICWQTRHRVFRPEMIQALTDPASYLLPGMGRPLSGGINFFSQIRIMPGSDVSLYLLRGAFIQQVPTLASAEQARVILRRAQTCARAAMEQHSDWLERAEGSDQVYWVGCSASTGRVGFQRVGLPSAAELTAPPERPGSGSAPAYAGGGGGSPRGGETAPSRGGRAPSEGLGGSPAPDGRAPAGPGGGGSAIGDLTDEDLIARLESNGRIRVDGSGRITVDGFSPFSERADPEALAQAWDSLADEDRLGMKVLYSRFRERAISEAEARRPAPEGQRYDYDPETGRAVLRDAVPFDKTL